MSGHLTGWRVSAGDEHSVFDGRGAKLASVPCGGLSGRTFDQGADAARLIAAAPCLLEALEAWATAQQATDDAVEHLERAIEEGWHDDPSGSGWIRQSEKLADEAWNRARSLRDAAITKSRGEA
ncbi:hypothetical protein [Croceicoccus sp. Ery15]|uniref:hypothetical protein n=1 Tax=Croceicoccus sp. Ery15 TaxID=1703338 RepID=UPI001E43CADC|nr:hypothetical protein [Croceicoccus sp. Ery15]